MGASPAKVGDRRLERLESILRSLTYLFIGFDLFKRQSERKAGRKRLRGWGRRGRSKTNKLTDCQLPAYSPSVCKTEAGEANCRSGELNPVESARGWQGD